MWCATIGSITELAFGDSTRYVPIEGVESGFPAGKQGARDIHCAH